MKYKLGDIVECKVSGIESYGIFVNIDENYTGLIHISEIDNGFINNINDYVKYGDMIHANIIGISEDTKHLSLSIKNMNYDLKSNSNKQDENIKGFLPLSQSLQGWIDNSKKRQIKNEQ